MEREILYRGKNPDNGKWYEGICSPYNWDFFGMRSEIPQIIIASEDKYMDGKWIEVIPETVGQFTGLTDKNGKKIFEGDIVHAVYQSNYVGCENIDYGIGVVKYYDTYYGGASYQIDIIGEIGSRVFTASL